MGQPQIEIINKMYLKYTPKCTRIISGTDLLYVRFKKEKKVDILN